MLVLSRKVNEKIRVGDDIEIQVCLIQGKKVRIGVTAPKGVPIKRIEYDAEGTEIPVPEKDNPQVR